MNRIGANWLDRLIIRLAPTYGLNRLRSKTTARLALRGYDAAGSGRRTAGWHRSSTDANGAAAGSLVRLRELSRDLRRNNGWAKRGIQVISSNSVGWGIKAKAKAETPELAKNAISLWDSWANSKACDFDGRLTFTGIQRLVMDTVVESGEALILKEAANASDGLPVPLRIRVVEPDYIDTRKTGNTESGGKIINGIELDGRGRRVAYWIYYEHPGALVSGTHATLSSRRIPDADVIHVFQVDRAGQMRGVPWLSSAIAKLNDFDDYDDARLMQAKIAACFGAFVTDIDGAGSAIGEQSGDDEEELLETLEPGHIEYLQPGKSITFPTTPNVSDHGAFSETQLRRIAASLGVTYEDLTGDYSRVNFSSARMARLAHWNNINEWRWNMLIPQLCDGVWSWFAELAAPLQGWKSTPTAEWSPPPMPMLSPEKEGLAYTRLIRSGVITYAQAVRERGEDPEGHIAEIQEWNNKLDAAGIVLDSDARKTSGAGLYQPAPPEQAAD